MKWIKKVILENFQSHKYTEIEFNNQLNIIVGESDSGKTAILRGIKWVLYNEPRGDFFINEKSTFCRVTVILNNDTIIKRYRDKTRNSYHLIIPESDEIVFEGFGSEVPYEIQNALGIEKIELNNDKSQIINLSEQLDGAFLLSESGSVKASSIGRLVGVNIVDDALKDSLRDLAALKNQKRIIDSDLDNLKKEMDDYKYLHEVKQKLDKLSEIKLLLDKKNKRNESLIFLKDQYYNISKEKNNIQITLDKTKDILILEEKLKLITLSNAKKISLENKHKKLIELNQNIKINNNICDITIYLNKVEQIIKHIEELIQKYHTLTILTTSYLENKKELVTTNYKLNLLVKIPSIEKEVVILEQKLYLFKKLYNYNTLITDMNKRIIIGNDYLNNFNDINKVNSIIYRIIDITNLRLSIENLKERYLNVSVKKLEEDKKLKSINFNFKNNLKKYKSLLEEQEVCPMCFSSINEDKINEIINIYVKEFNYEI